MAIRKLLLHLLLYNFLLFRYDKVWSQLSSDKTCHSKDAVVEERQSFFNVLLRVARRGDERSRFEYAVEGMSRVFLSECFDLSKDCGKVELLLGFGGFNCELDNVMLGFLRVFQNAAHNSACFNLSRLVRLQGDDTDLLRMHHPGYDSVVALIILQVNVHLRCWAVCLMNWAHEEF